MNISFPIDKKDLALAIPAFLEAHANSDEFKKLLRKVKADFIREMEGNLQTDLKVSVEDLQGYLSRVFQLSANILEMLEQIKNAEKELETELKKEDS